MPEYASISSAYKFLKINYLKVIIHTFNMNSS